MDFLTGIAHAGVWMPMSPRVYGTLRFPCLSTHIDRSVIGRYVWVLRGGAAAQSTHRDAERNERGCWRARACDMCVWTEVGSLGFLCSFLSSLWQVFSCFLRMI